MSRLEELKQKNVFRVGIAYLAASWLLLQILGAAAPVLQLPDQVTRYTLFFLAIGFISALIITWAQETKPIRKSALPQPVEARGGGGLDRAIIVLLVCAAGLFLFDRFALQNNPEMVDSDQAVPAPDKVVVNSIDAQADLLAPESVAVLPFAAISTGPDDEYFSAGFTEEIINTLAQLPALRVTSRTSAFHFGERNIPAGDIARQLGVDHVVEGSVSRAGEQLSVTAQLIRAEDGVPLWSQSYDRRTEDSFDVQSDIAEKVATALDVVLNDEKWALLRQSGIRNAEAYTAYQKGVEAHTKALGAGIYIPQMREGNRHFEDAFALAPVYSDAYLHHAGLYVQIMMAQARGRLDGNITASDIQAAPAAMSRDYDLAISHAKNHGQRLAAAYDRALLLGRWKGLASFARRALSAPGCKNAFWAYLGGSAFGQALLVRNAYGQTAGCDPLVARSWIHLANAHLWLGRPGRAAGVARQRLNVASQQELALTYALALDRSGQKDEAQQFVSNEINPGQERFKAESILAAMNGDAAAAKNRLEQYRAVRGPDDLFPLVLNAQQGNRNEANRLAGEIDQRPFGYMVLMQAIYHCLCGAPFDLENTPEFASMLPGSGLSWPPERPVEFPLKDW